MITVTWRRTEYKCKICGAKYVSSHDKTKYQCIKTEQCVKKKATLKAVKVIKEWQEKQ